MAPSPGDADVVDPTDLHVEATYRLTEALAASESQMLRRVQLLSEVVFEIDADGCFVFLNDAWEKAIGAPPATALGHSLREYVLEEDLPICERALAGHQPATPATRPLLRMRRPDGGVTWVELSLDRIAGGGAVGVLHDVTQQKLAQEELTKLSLVASYTDNLVLITDGRGRTEWVNQAFTRRTGYTLEEIAGRSPGEVLQGADTDPETVQRIRDQLREGLSFETEILNYTKAGEPYWVQIHITPVRDDHGAVERFVSIQTDSTELRGTQHELEVAMVRAEAANEAKTQFLATISHEMRTPLNAILGSAELALTDDAAPDELTEHLTRINSGAEALLKLITDVLDVSKIETGEIDVEQVPMDLRACLGDAVTPIRTRAAAKGLGFELVVDEALPETVLGDPGRLRQIVTNLAENAVKFTDAGGVVVEAAVAEVARTHPAELEIRVVDTGIGIPRDVQEHIFERFVQVDSTTTRRTGGVGLGLNIVRSLVEALGGTVAVVSVPGEGAEFRVRLPLVSVAATQAPAAAPPAQAGVDAGARERAAHTRVLVAEDNDINFAVLEAYLTRAGHPVERAVDGNEAVAAAPGCDLILMDVEMPELDGLEATRRIRERERERGAEPVPVLALTAHALQEYRERCLDAGCTGYLAKPVRMAALLDAIAAVLPERDPGGTRT